MKPFGLSFLVAALGLAAVSCDSARSRTSICPVACKQCDPVAGCQDCKPMQDFCDGDNVVSCSADGTAGSVVKMCDAARNAPCMNGQCVSPCEAAAATRSYIGCDYWPVTLMNSPLDSLFDFAVAVANPVAIGDVTTGGPATVKIVQGSAPCEPFGDPGDAVAYTTVSPGQVKTLILPWVSELSQNLLVEVSTLSTGGAYHLCSTLPVTVYQFNPLQYQKPAAKCIADPNPTAGECHSYTNDASTLLPTTALQKEYIVAAYGSYGVLPAPTVQNPRPQPQTTPGFFAVVATEDGTNVTVTYSAFSSGGTNVIQHKPGESETYLLDKGDVLEVASKKPTWSPTSPTPPCVKTTSSGGRTFCDLGHDYDLTGSRIVADKPIAVFGGHSCALVPYNKMACDHLEQQLIPLESWGKQTLAVQTPPQQTNEPNLFRVISGTPQTTITFDPPVLKPVTLDAGQWVEVVAQGAVAVSGTTAAGTNARLLVAQFMVGADYTGVFTLDSEGDPSMGMAIPTEQYRKSYDFLSPDTYTHSFVTVIGEAGTRLTLDNTDMTIGFAQNIGSTDYAFEYVELMPGAHHITSDKPFGINVSGVAPYTSYFYPGGMNLLELLPQ